MTQQQHIYKQGSLLKKINSPADVKVLPKDKLPELCQQIREYIIEVLAENPGHLASSLGTVELTVALHYVFNVPEDSLIWDVGHQAYGHKVITGRKDSFSTIRKLGGLSGFPKPFESPYDCFATGHSSTSLSATLGMAIADKLNGFDKRQHIAVIGDGSMTGGMAYEALNQAGTSDVNMLIVLNDNGISIDKRVGALSQYLTNITSSAKYNHLKNKIWNLLGGNADVYTKHKTILKRILFSFKSFFSGKSNFFEALRIRYFGPINGNDVLSLVKVFESLKDINGVKILHIITKKGKGLKEAENNPTTYHAPGIFDPQTGKQEKSSTNGQAIKYQDVFGNTLVELAKQNDKIVGITPAMLSGCSMNKMKEAFPQRCFDVGIAEEHAVTLCAAMAARGIIPVCNIYSSFAQRAFDQLIGDVALQRLPIILCLDRAGLVGEDGSTHHGVFDLSYTNLIPNLTIMAPMNEWELRDMLFTAVELHDRPFIIRYPRGKGVIVDWHNQMNQIPLGKGVKVNEGNDLVILSLGTIGNNVIKATEILAQEGIHVAHYNMRFLKPLDYALLAELFAQYKHIITIEDGVKIGGFGSAVCSYYEQKGLEGNHIYVMGIEDNFVEHGSVEELQRLCKIDSHSLYVKVKNILTSSTML
jgi:1-deoxy-D-xylulose-5-phosphate synthase